VRQLPPLNQACPSVCYPHNILISWDKVSRPFDLGGLGIPNLLTMNWALQIHWLWLQKTAPSKPWSGLDLKISPQVRALFQAAVATTIGNGSTTFFWKDRWIHGCCVKDTAPLIVAAVPKKYRDERTVQQALTDLTWVQDIQGNLSLTGIEQYLQLWVVLGGFQLQNNNDNRVWRWR
jgi:hypothetical protein